MWLKERRIWSKNRNWWQRGGFGLWSDKSKSGFVTEKVREKSAVGTFFKHYTPNSTLQCCYTKPLSSSVHENLCIYINIETESKLQNAWRRNWLSGFLFGLLIERVGWSAWQRERIVSFFFKIQAFFLLFFSVHFYDFSTKHCIYLESTKTFILLVFLSFFPSFRL